MVDRRRPCHLMMMSLVIITLFGGLLLGGRPRAQSSPALPEGVVGLFERTDGGYFTLVEEETENVVTKAARILDIGDSYIDSDNQCYEVTRVEEDIIYVRSTGESVLEVSQVKANSVIMRLPWLQSLLARVTNPAPRRIGLYCTHSDESYIPTSGTSSKEWGDVYRVGETLKQEFEKRGFAVDLSYNNHNPHDSQAYVRSRRTVADLMRNRPLVIVDIHRDAVPESEYRAVVKGDELSKIQLVVGRQNQNRDANLQFAKAVKAEADQQYPGLVKGIFNAKGNYNQDLGPRSVLLEFGTHETSLSMAEKAADLISDVLPAAARASTAPMGASGYRSVLWIIGLLIVAAVGFVAVNAVGWQGIRNFFGREFASAFGIGGKKRLSRGGHEKEDADQGTDETAGEKDD